MTREGEPQELGRHQLPGSPLAPSAARSFVEATLVRHHLEALLEPALLLTSEGVTNAVTHARSKSTLLILIVGNVVRISVLDEGYGTFVVGEANPHALGGGRGLFIIDQMSLAWGTRHTDQGTEIWFDLPLP